MGVSDLEVAMKSIFDNGKYSDMTISCEEHDFRVHRAIICSQSSFFDAALKGGFEVSGILGCSQCGISDSLGKEAASSRISLPDDDVETISCVVSFCYLQDYSQTGDSVSESDVVARNDLRVYLAADKFDIQPLQQLAITRIINWANSNWMSENFPEIVQDIWCSTPPHENKLRDAISGVVSTKIQHFLAQGSGHNVLIDNPELAIAVLKHVADSEAQLRGRNDTLMEENNTHTRVERMLRDRLAEPNDTPAPKAKALLYKHLNN